MFPLITLNMPIISDLGKPQKKCQWPRCLGGMGVLADYFVLLVFNALFFLGRCCKKLFVNILFTFSEI